MPSPPEPVDRLVGVLARMPGAESVVLGGSRALGVATPDSDWDLGVYYRGAIDTTALAPFGTVYAPGSWGRVMNGGAWLTLDGLKVDVLLRDLDVVDAWSARAREGEFDIDALLGYVAGVPTYSVMAERSVAVVLRGEPHDPEPLPPRLAERAPARWRFCSDFSLRYAQMHAAHEEVVGVVGQASKAILEEGHARMCERGAWVLNEKRLVEDAGLAGLRRRFREVPGSARELSAWVDSVRSDLADPR